MIRTMMMTEFHRNSTYPGVAAAALLLTLLAAPPAAARNKEVKRLQVQMQALQTQVADLRHLLEDTRRELQRLNESLAEQGALMRRGAEDQRLQAETVAAAVQGMHDSVVRIEEQLKGQAAAFANAAPPVAGSGPGTPQPAPRQLFSQAYGDYSRGNYDLAIQGFQEYLRAYPDTGFSDNAQYWIGECLYGKGEHLQAIEAWDVLLVEHAESDKVPDTRLKKGFALEALGRRSQALLEYRYVIDRFPASSAARIARERLNPR